ncbi:hypothetical protein [Sporotomaculum syntrophicum]|nr:hypothetical protein [Sporotomaculum syntrophicum]
MNKDHDHWNCPICRGEFYSAAAACGIDDAWQYSMTHFYKAMRDEKRTTRVDRKVARLAGIS